MKSKLLRLAGFIFLFSTVITPLTAKAATISPPFFDYSLNPGDTVSDVIKVYNETSLSTTLYPIAVNFTSGEDENGVPSFYPQGQNDDGSALAQWISYSKDPITLEPGQRGNISFSITVPSNGQPGGHYGGIILSSAPPEEQAGTIGVGSQLASIMLLRVSGDVIEQGSIEEFGFGDGKTVYSHLPVGFYLRFKNEGTTHLRPAGNTFIKNMFGMQSASIEINPEFGGVLPNSIRKYSFMWSKTGVDSNSSELMNELRNFGFGRYRASVILNYGKDNKHALAERTFWVLPWMLMIIGFIVLVILWFMLKLYNRSVVKTYERKKAKNE
jgi:hypothetical protein